MTGEATPEPTGPSRRARRLAVAATAVIAVLLPLVLVVNGLLVTANDWYVHAAYDRPGFPPDRLGELTQEQRIDLALIGLRSIQPQHEEGVQVLREATLPDGTPAFKEREIQHMQDVRDLVGVFTTAHLWSVVAIAVLAVALARRPWSRRYLPRAAFGGAAFGLGLAAVVGLMMLVAWDWFFTAFHHAFFEGMTWYFYRGDTLLRIYPNRFWNDFGFVMGAIALVQALVLLVGSWLWLRRARRRAAAAVPAPAVPALAVAEADAADSG